MLLMLHGQAASNDQWIRLGITNAADDLIRQEEILPLIIVMPFEVTWTPGPSESQFDEALLEDVLPYVEANYAVCAQRACRAVGGLSRGGNWAVHLGFTHPEIFGVIGAHSTPLFYGEIWNIQAAAKLPADEIPLIFVDAGDRDADKEKVAEFVTALEEAGIPRNGRTIHPFAIRVVSASAVAAAVPAAWLAPVPPGRPPRPASRRHRAAPWPWERRRPEG